MIARRTLRHAAMFFWAMCVTFKALGDWAPGAAAGFVAAFVTGWWVARVLRPPFDA